MFFGGSILSFVLPMAAFIVIAGLLFWLYRRPHHNPQLKYLEPETVTAVGTREPGPVPVPAATAPATPAAAEAKAEGQVTDLETEGKEGTE
jgi:hypothetical protein